jgi:hypothetical protein
MLTLLPKGVQTKYLKLFLLKTFSICHRCQRHWWCTLSCNISANFRKNSKQPYNGILRRMGKLIHQKIPEVENLVTLSLL